MVTDMNQDYRYIAADESELDELLAGRGDGRTRLLDRWSTRRLPHSGQAGIVAAPGRSRYEPLRPLALIAHEESLRRLFGRYAQLRSDLSPITAWCHYLTPDFFESMKGVTRVPDLRGTDAAWSGLIVAEAMLLGERPLASVRISACFASQSYAIARTKALWGNIATDVILKHFDAANRLCRPGSANQRNEARMGRIRVSLQPIWASLTALLDPFHSGHHWGDLGPIVAALRALQKARELKVPEEAHIFAEPLYHAVPEVQQFSSLSKATPEERLRIFDRLVDALNELKGEQTLRRNALALLAGYLATIAAGGAPSLALVESNADRWPELTAWAYLIGGIGEKIVWTSSFDGLGRLVARELRRPLRLDEPPVCDFAYDEAVAVADPKLADPLVHLRIKQARVLSVALFPGVNVSIPIGDSAAADLAKQEPSRSERATRAEDATESSGPLALFAEALWPFLRTHIAEFLTSREGPPPSDQGSKNLAKGRAKRRVSSDLDLPFRRTQK